MKRVGASLKIAAALAVVACTMAVTAASAMAVSIEPLSTKFTGSASEAVWDAGDGSWHCSKNTMVGTTNSTKTNFMEGTPSFAECSSTVTYANECVGKPTPPIPWRLTFNEGGGGTLKTNCSLKATIFGACVMTAPPQTITSAFHWENVGTKALRVSFLKTPFKFNAATKTCESIGFTALERKFTADYEFPGLQVH